MEPRYADPETVVFARPSESPTALSTEYPPPPPPQSIEQPDGSLVYPGRNGVVLPEALRCPAQSKQTGQRCRRPKARGANTCIIHGSGTADAKRAAQLRLMELVNPAIATLAREMVKAERSADKIRAANSLLDRAGIGRQGPDADQARALLVERLLALRDGPEAETLVAEVIDDAELHDDEHDD